MNPQLLDLTAEPGVQPCDKCERIVECRLFACFYLCPLCLPAAVEGIGLEAAGRAFERLARLYRRTEEMEKFLMDLYRELDESQERAAADAAMVEQLLEGRA